MRSTLILTALSCVGLAAAQSNTVPVTGILGNATIVSTNPKGVTYKATLPSIAGKPSGSITGVSSNGTGVAFSVAFSGLPTSGGPFLYHIHDAPVPSNGNCTGTLAHLDPFQRGEQPPCNPALPATCQVGDLAGKYGTIKADPFSATFTDPYASTLKGLGSFFGNRSIVIHFANTTRITCANFTLISNGTTTTTSTSSSAASTTTVVAKTTNATSTVTGVAKTTASNATSTTTGTAKGTNATTTTTGTAKTTGTSTATTSSKPTTFTGGAVAVAASYVTVFGGLMAALML